MDAEIRFFALFARNLRKLADEITFDTLALVVLIDLIYKVNKMINFIILKKT